MKVLHITNMYPKEEKVHFGSFVKTQIDALKRCRNLQIEVLVIKDGKGLLRYLRSIGDILHEVRREYDIIHCHFGHTGSIVKLLNPRKPIITSYCGSDLFGTMTKNNKIPFKSRMLAKINAMLANRDSWSIVKSESLKKKLKKNKNISVIPNGVDLHIFKPIDRSIAVNRLGLDPDKRYILFPADPENPVKNYDLLERSIDLICEQSDIEVLNFEKKVPNCDVVWYMNSAHVVVLPSYHEGSPNVVKEAMACNRPIVATNVGDVFMLLAGVQNCSVVDFDPKMLCSKIQKYTDSFLSSNGRKHLIDLQLDQESVAKRILGIYERVYSGPRK